MHKKNHSGGIVYSTDSQFQYEAEEKPGNEILSPAEQRLQVKLDTRQRGGKAVTVVSGYQGADLEEVGKKIKVFCGTGGSVKDGQILVQGDQREKVLQWLIKAGFSKSKSL